MDFIPLPRHLNPDIPKSPIYPPPDVYSDVSNEDSPQDLTYEDVEEDHTDPSQKNPR